jgi:hypothetical protein
MRPFLFALMLGLMAPAAASAAPEPQGHAYNSCFASNQWTGWSAPGNGDVLLLKVGLHDVYRVELSEGTRVYRDADRFLVNRLHGSNWICSPLDLNLTLSDRHGFEEPLIARSLRRLSPEEISRIPPRDRPY